MIWELLLKALKVKKRRRLTGKSKQLIRAISYLKIPGASPQVR
jgi:hypothetical protein